MTTPSHFSETGLTIHAEQPLWASALKYNIRLSSFTEAYSHTLGANGGYLSARIGLKLNQGDIEEWIENGIGRQITVYNEGGAVKWEGFVNDIDWNFGNLTISLNCFGYIEWLKAYIYNVLTAGDTTLSVRIIAVLAADPNGIISTDYSKITLNALPVPAWENDNPKALDYINGLVVRGDAAFNRYTFGIYAGRRAYYTVMPTTQEYIAHIGNLSGKRGPLMAVANKVALVYSTVDTSVTPPAVGVRKTTPYATDVPSQAKYGIIEKLLSSGGSTDANATNIRDVFIGDNHEPETTETISIAGSGEIYTPNGNIVRPWEVVPAKWAHIPDFMIGRIGDMTAMRNDPRYMFIESLTYTAPYSLTLTGAKVSKLPQILAQRGLAGIGA
jgi:hypothetical protein